MSPHKKYTCSEYREEMRLIALRKHLNQENLSRIEKRMIKAEILRLEKSLQLD